MLLEDYNILRVIVSLQCHRFWLVIVTEDFFLLFQQKVGKHSGLATAKIRPQQALVVEGLRSHFVGLNFDSVELSAYFAFITKHTLKKFPYKHEDFKHVEI